MSGDKAKPKIRRATIEEGESFPDEPEHHPQCTCIECELLAVETFWGVPDDEWKDLVDAVGTDVNEAMHKAWEEAEKRKSNEESDDS